MSHVAVQQKPLPFVPQAPLAHSPFAPHGDPAVSLHEPLEHVYPLWQSLPPVHVVRHAVPPALQLKPLGQPAVIVPPEHVPAPLHASCVVSIEPLQDAELQLVVAS